MTDGMSALDRQIARLRELGRLVPVSTPVVASAVKDELAAQLRRGEAPDGRPWAKTAEGRDALPNAARDLSVRPVGTTIVCRIDGVHARHHFGHVRGGIKRQILPSGKIPDPVVVAIDKVITREFRKTMGGK